MTGLYFTQLMLSVGLATGPLLCQPFLHLQPFVNPILDNNSLPSNPSTDPAINIKTIVMINVSATVTPLPYDVTNATSGPKMSSAWLPPSPFYFIYVISGVAQVFMGLLFVTLWLRTKEPTFFDRASSFDFSARRSIVSGESMKGWSWEKFYNGCLTLSLVLLSFGQLGMEMAYQVRRATCL